MTTATNTLPRTEAPAAETGQPSVRLLICDDSIFMRMAIRTLCEEHEDIEIVGEAKDGKEAIEMVTSLRPDVITMDVDMPGIDGVSATQTIVESHRIPVIILSGLTQRRSALANQFLESGAVDVIWKSASMMDIDIGGIAHTIIEKVLFWGRPVLPAASDIEDSAPSVQPFDVTLLTLGEGGASALMQTLAPLPPDGPPLLVAAQAPVACAEGLMRMMGRLTGLRVVQASEGLVLETGMVVLVSGMTRYQLVSDGQMLYFRKTSALLTHGAVFGPLHQGLISFGLNVMCIALSGSSADREYIQASAQSHTQLFVQDPATCAKPEGCLDLLDTVDFARPLSLSTIKNVLRHQ